jgi:lauroyl/myristoyl acyltransferase
MSFCGSLVPKIGLSRGGFAIAHLSTPHHGGFSRSRVAVQVLNRWAQRVENRHLAQRVVIPFDWSLEHLRILKRQLAGNGVISIAGEHRGDKTVPADVLGDTTHFATGAPRLARSTGAALLTMYSYRTAPQRYSVVVEPPIDVRRTHQPGSDLQSAVEAFACRLEHHIARHAADWDGWSAFDLDVSTRVT